MSETKQPKLTAANLKNALWETLNNVKDGKTPFSDADAIATQAREILRTVKTQLQVASAAQRSVPQEVINFAENAQ